MDEKCGDHLIDSPQALNYDAPNLLLLTEWRVGLS
jgi:hypothetical protein